MDTSGRAVTTVPLEGGHLALDFVNTIGGLRIEPPSPADELLDTYEDLVVWCVRLGVVAEPDAEVLTRAAGADEKAARRALRRAKQLRELVYAIFRPLAEGGEPPADLDYQGCFLGLAYAHAGHDAPLNDPYDLNGFLTVSPKKFAELPDDVYLEFRRKGWIGLIHLHLASVLNWERLVALTSRQ